MECRAAPLLLLLPLLISSLNTATLSSLPPSPSPSSTPTPNHTTPSSSFALDPKQLSAVRSLGLPTITDPCSGPDAACDSASPFRHVTSLLLADCPPDLSLLPLRALSGSLQSLALLRCPAAPPPSRRFPLSLQSFSCSASLRRLSGVWLSRLRSLTHLSVSDVPITATGPWVVLSHMPRLQYFALSRANLSGEIPRHWHALNLSHIDLSSNRLKGPVPESIAVLSSLEFLNLSSNSLTGALPDSIGDLGSLKNASFSNNSISGAIPSSVLAMSALVHLDLSSNRFNDSIPRFLSEMKGLRYLNLEDNNFHGVVPFNESFIKGMEVFRVGGNGDLCYNRTLLSSKLKLGIAPCDKYGLPVSPPAAKPGRSDDSEDDGDDEGDGQREGNSKGGSGHRGPSKVVLGVGIGLACLVFLVVFLVCISKLCS